MDLATLRALTYRISSTPVSQLPRHAPAIVASLTNCKSLLSASQVLSSRNGSDAVTAIHKYRTILATLLQDKTIHGRWTAIILIKATIEIGGWETLHKSLSWVRGLLVILAKPDPPSSRRLCFITLTRLFILTREYPTLIREITTPSLPALIQIGIQIYSSTSSQELQETILHCFNQLLPRHPTVFRSYLKQLQPLLLRTLAITPSSTLGLDQKFGNDLPLCSHICTIAQRLYVQLHSCAPKGNLSDDWQRSVDKSLRSAHRAAGYVFRAILEDRARGRPGDGLPNEFLTGEEIQDLKGDDLGLPPWQGFFAGSERLLCLLNLVRAHIQSSTMDPVQLNVGGILDLSSRILSITIPLSASEGIHPPTRFNSMISNQEREQLWTVLPNLHVAALDLLLAIMHRCEDIVMAIQTIMLDHICYNFTFNSFAADYRTNSYLAIAKLLRHCGLTLSKTTVESLSTLIRACCHDILPSDAKVESITRAMPITSKDTKGAVSANADSFLSHMKSLNTGSLIVNETTTAACELFPFFIQKIRTNHLADSLRSKIDRTAILVMHKNTMLNSVLNPPRRRGTGQLIGHIMPLVTRIFPSAMEVEALIRPRVPIVRTSDEAGNENQTEKEVLDFSSDSDLMAGGDGNEEDVDGITRYDNSNELLKSAVNAMPNLSDTLLAKDTHPEPLPDTVSTLSQSREHVIVEQEREQNLLTPKRYSGEDERSSISKRIKMDMSDYEPSAASNNSLTTKPLPVITPNHVDSLSRVAIVHNVSQGTNSVSSPATKKNQRESDSDKDDIISLVLGPDTDDEDSE